MFDFFSIHRPETMFVPTELLFIAEYTHPPPLPTQNKKGEKKKKRNLAFKKTYFFIYSKTVMTN